eukprot:2146050-Pyramimonas_sp.AAC.1
MALPSSAQPGEQNSHSTCFSRAPPNPGTVCIPPTSATPSGRGNVNTTRSQADSCARRRNSSSSI